MNNKASEIKLINGGVCAPKGFRASGIHCGLKAGSDPNKNDLALIASNTKGAAAAVYTTNKVKGAPLTVTKMHLADGHAQAVIANSVNANTCNADGVAVASQMSQLAAGALNTAWGTAIEPDDVIVASTGVIGQPLPIGPIENAIDELAAKVSADGGHDAASAIMTTDLVSKEAAVEFEIGGVPCRIGGMAKGSGMIHPNMATMLVFLTSDAAIAPAMLEKALKSDIEDTFNMISVDGDTSTNDMVTIIANGTAGNPEIAEAGEAFDTFYAALHEVMSTLCKMIASDGEGASKLLTCRVCGASDKQTAKTVAKSVICSNLVKAAMAGEDANWGRVLCAIGYSNTDLDVTKVEVSFRTKAGQVDVCRDGAGIAFSEEEAAKVLAEHDIDILIDLHDGEAEAVAWGCDLTHGYITINTDYRT